MNDQAVTYLKNIQSAVDQLKSLPTLMERVASSNERIEQLKQIYALLERIAVSNERILALLESGQEDKRPGGWSR